MISTRGTRWSHLALAGFEKDPIRADFLRRYSLDRLPNDPKLRQRAAVSCASREKRIWRGELRVKSNSPVHYLRKQIWTRYPDARRTARNHRVLYRSADRMKLQRSIRFASEDSEAARWVVYPGLIAARIDRATVLRRRYRQAYHFVRFDFFTSPSSQRVQAKTLANV